MKGLQGQMQYNNFLNFIQRQTLERLAEIEREDDDRCANCGGEDCVCCEYYLDRQKWKSPDELLDEWSSYRDEFVPITYDDEDEELDE